MASRVTPDVHPFLGQGHFGRFVQVQGPGLSAVVFEVDEELHNEQWLKRPWGLCLFVSVDLGD